MVDTFSRGERSVIMASVKSRNNKSTELRFISALNGVTGWRRTYPIVGKPDFVFPRARMAVFIDGCFWHGCPKHCRMPSSNVKYWNAKINGNIARDKRVKEALKIKGWKVIRIWEHEMKSVSPSHKINKVRKIAQNGITNLL